MDSAPLLRLRAIQRTYPGAVPTVALKHIDLDIARGDFLAVEGPSGGGKSTLLNVIGLLDSPTAGSYQIAGVEASTLTELERARMRLQQFAFIFQSFHLLDRRPVVDSVELGLRYQNVPAQERQERALSALRQLGLGHRAYHLASTLSGGERQRVAIARALASKAPILIADEPTGNLDSGNSQQVMAALRQLHLLGTTIILVTHSPEIATEASRRITIKDGRTIAQSDNSTATLAYPVTPDCASTPDADTANVHEPTTNTTLPRRLKDLIVDATASVRSRTGRTIALASAVGVGVALFVGTLGISATATTQVSNAFDAHTNRDVAVRWNQTTTSDMSAQESETLVKRLDDLSGVDAAGILTNLGQTTTQAGLARPTFDVDGYTITPQTPKAARLTISWASHTHRSLNDGEILVGAALAKKIELGPLDGSPIILVDNRPMTVIGIIHKSPRFPALLGGITTADNELASASITQQQAVILTQPGAAQQVARQAPLVIYPYDTTKLDVDAPIDPATLRVRVQQELQSTLLALTAVALLAAIASLTNSMTTSVLERKHEFGLRRAVGATASQIRNLVLTEATLIGSVGGIIGLTAGLAGILGITLAQHWSPIFDLRLAPLAVVGGILVGISSGGLAARRASKIQPHEALRS